jgi:hypothetical protein
MPAHSGDIADNTAEISSRIGLLGELEVEMQSPEVAPSST